MIILTILTIVLFLASLFMFGVSANSVVKQKLEIENMQKIIDDNIKLSGQLYKLYSALQENQSLQIKAFEVMSKNQKITSADVIELREQVSQALVAIVEQISGGVSNIETATLKNGKFRLN